MNVRAKHGFSYSNLQRRPGWCSKGNVENRMAYLRTKIDTLKAELAELKILQDMGYPEARQKLRDELAGKSQGDDV